MLQKWSIIIIIIPGLIHVNLQGGRARWPLGFTLNSSRIFRNVTPSNAKWLKISLGEDLGLDLETVWGWIWGRSGDGFGEDLGMDLEKIWGWI